ncbi:MAG: Ig-like domain-containing protein [bacterium]
MSILCFGFFAGLLFSAPVSSNAQVDITSPVTSVEFVGPVYQPAEPPPYISTHTLVKLVASDQGPDASGVAITFFLKDVSFPECQGIPPDPVEPAGTCPNPVYPGPFVLSEGTHTVYFRSRDNAGNIEQPRQKAVFTDGTYPSTVMDAEGPYFEDEGTIFAAGWTSFTLTGTDPVSNGLASGLATTYFLIDVSSEDCTGPPTFTEPAGTCDNPVYSELFILPIGTHTVYYGSADNVDNREPLHTSSITIRPPPPPPQNVEPVSLSTFSITWSWEAVPGASGYSVYLPGGIFLSSVTEPGFTRTGLQSNTEHAVCVSAYNFFGESLPSCSPPAYTLAKIPGMPEFSDVGHGGFTVLWGSGGNPPGTLYELLISTTDNFQTLFSTFVQTTAGYMDMTGLAADATYYAKIRAINGEGFPSPFSNTASTRTLLSPPPAPINLAVVFDTAAKTVLLSWQPDSSGTPAAHYRIYRKTGPQFIPVASSTDAFWSEPVLDSGVFFYRVSAVNADNLEGSPCEPVSVTADIHPPQPVSDLRATVFDSGTARVLLAWTAPPDDLTGPATYFIRAATEPVTQLRWDSAVPVAQVAASTGSGGPESAYIPVLSSSAVQFFALRTADQADNLSPVSNPALFDPVPPSVSISTPIPNTVISRPLVVKAAASDNDIVDRVVFYADGVAIATAASHPYNTVWDILALPDGSHVFSARAYDRYGNFAEQQVPVVISYSPPPAPEITWPQNGFTSAVPSIAVSGKSEPVYVLLFVNDVLAAAQKAVPPGFFSMADVQLGTDGPVILTAQAVDRRGGSAYSAPVSGVVDTGPPAPPQSLSADSIPGGAVRLSWSLPSGEVPVSYLIYRAASESSLEVATSAASSFIIGQAVGSFEFSDFAPVGVVYYYAATSIDAAGNESGFSDIVSAVSDSIAPSAAILLPLAVPPLGAGGYRLEAAVTETLASKPYLTFTPYNGFPVQISLEPETSVLWVGTLTVTQEMASGAGTFGFSGTDLSGNIGSAITSGASLLLETAGPVAVLSFVPPVPPALKSGEYGLELVLDEPARTAPYLSFTGQSGSTTTVYLSSSASASLWSGSLTVSPAIGDGPAYFSYSAYDTLGNRGELLSGTAYFTVDTVAPGAPLSLNFSAGPAGKVNLSWSAPSGERPAAYCVYRDSAKVTCGVIPDPVDFTGFYGDIPSEGSHAYEVVSLDAAGNESGPSNAVNTVSDSTPPAPPVISAVPEADRINLTWIADPGETPARYRLYRSTYAVTGTAGAPYRVIIGLSAEDSPEADGAYYYYLTALDAAGNESILSVPAQVTYNGAAPVITVTGIENNAYYNHPVIPAINITDLNLSQQTLALDGSPFVSGSTVSAEGGHTLAVSATDASGHSSQKTVFFTIDLTKPVVSISGVEENGY